MKTINEKEVIEELDEQDQDRDERNTRHAQFAPVRPDPVIDLTCNTPLEYLGDGKVPFLIGADMIVFHPKRPVHLMPRANAEKLAARDPSTWRIVDEAPVYPEDEQVEEYYDLDTAEGRGALRAAFFNDPEATYRKITAVFWQKIEQLEADKAGLTQKVAQLQADLAHARSGQPGATAPGATAPGATPGATPAKPASKRVEPPKPKPLATGAPTFDHIDPVLLGRVLPFVTDPASLDEAMSAAKLNGGQQMALRKAATEFAEFRTPETAEEFAVKLDKYLPGDGSDAVDDAGDDDPDDLDPTNAE